MKQQRQPANRKRLGGLLFAALFAFGPHAAAARAAENVLPVDAVRVERDEKAPSEERLLRLVPELSRKDVRVKVLARQIQAVNDGGAYTMRADFAQNDGGRYDITLHVETQKIDGVTISAANSGDDYTGDWRVSAVYTNKDISGRGDALGVAYVTSPDEHFSDVKQAAVAYHAPLQRANGGLTFTYSYSDVDLGQIANFGGIGIQATGRGQAGSLHYQQHLLYTKAHKQIFDIGYNYKHYSNANDYDYYGQPLLRDGATFDVHTASVNYIDIARGDRRILGYWLGYTRSLGNGDHFEDYRPGSAKRYGYFKAGVNYQWKTGDWILGARVNGQFTRDDLVTTEQIGAGGTTTVRGFKERVASADSGYVANFECYTPELFQNSRFVIFTDVARLVNNHSYSGELRSENLASVGIGYRYNDVKNGLSLAIDYATPYDDLDQGIAHAHRPWHIAVSKMF